MLAGLHQRVRLGRLRRREHGVNHRLDAAGFDQRPDMLTQCRRDGALEGDGPRAQATRAFARNVANSLSLPVALWDERLSTAAMERDLIAIDTSRAKRAAKIDESAATVILQGAIELLERGHTLTVLRSPDGIHGPVEAIEAGRCVREGSFL